MGSVARKLDVTPEEYLAGERKAEFRSQYLDGEVFAMTGASRKHNMVVGNTFALLHARLAGGACEVYVSDMRVKVADTGLCTYPDVVVACGDIRFEDEHVDTLLNPTLIIEVLSPTTEAFDRGTKFAHYRRLGSLQEYMLIAQDRVLVERFSRQGSSWLLSEANTLDQAMALDSIGCELSLGAVYERVEFGEKEDEAQAVEQ